MRHFKEQVVESIPFHEKILSQHKKRLETINQIIPYWQYRKLMSITMKYGGCPEYIVYDKNVKRYFFVSEELDEAKQHWIKKTGKIADTIVVSKKNINIHIGILQEVENDIM